MSPVKKIQQWFYRTFSGNEFLCDNCMLDHPSTCVHNARPNATSCPDFKKK